MPYEVPLFRKQVATAPVIVLKPSLQYHGCEPICIHHLCPGWKVDQTWVRSLALPGDLEHMGLFILSLSYIMCTTETTTIFILYLIQPQGE